MNQDKKENVRLDHRIICDIIEPGSTVLDLGCGNGDLLVLLRLEKKVKGQGIELKESAIFACVEKGLSVFHMDFDTGLSSYPDKSFDYVILNQSLQETLHVEFVLQEALRVGKRVVVGFPNFAHLRARVQLFFRGRTPVTNALPHLWYNTPNLHFLSISDFERFTAERNIKVLERYYYFGSSLVRFLPNLFAMNAIYVINGALRA
jgi:methionine biosynthesis protein MetW